MFLLVLLMFQVLKVKPVIFQLSMELKTDSRLCKSSLESYQNDLILPLDLLYSPLMLADIMSILCCPRGYQQPPHVTFQTYQQPPQLLPTLDQQHQQVLSHFGHISSLFLLCINKFTAPQLHHNNLLLMPLVVKLFTNISQIFLCSSKQCLSNHLVTTTTWIWEKALTCPSIKV